MPTKSGELSRAINYAAKHRVISVAAAGNEGHITKMFPAADSKAIAAGATANDDRRKRVLELRRYVQRENCHAWGDSRDQLSGGALGCRVWDVVQRRADIRRSRPYAAGLPEAGSQ